MQLFILYFILLEITLVFNLLLILLLYHQERKNYFNSKVMYLLSFMLAMTIFPILNNLSVIFVMFYIKKYRINYEKSY